MRKRSKNAMGLWALSGIAASTAIVALLVDLGADPFDPLAMACQAAAALSLAGALVQARAARRTWGLRLTPGEALELKEYRLTSREEESVLELAAGYSVREMAFRHDVADSTVRVLLCSAYKKLAVKGKAELLAFLKGHIIKK